MVVILFAAFRSMGSDAPNTVTGTISYAGFLNPVALAFSSDNSKLLIADDSANAIFQVDLGLKAVDPALTFSVTYPTAIAARTDNKVAYVLSPVTNTVTAFNTTTLENIAGLLMVDQQTVTLAIAPDNLTVYVLGVNTGLNEAYVTLIDTNANVIEKKITIIGGYQGQADIVVSPDGSTLYVSNSLSGTITVIDSSDYTQSTISSLSPYPLSGASFLAITPNGQTLCVTGGSGNWTSEVDLTVTPPTSAFSTNSAKAISFIAITPNGTTAYFAYQNTTTASESSIDILDVASNNVTGSLDIGSFFITTPNSIALRPNTNRGYIANGYNLDTSEIGYISIFNTDMVVPNSPTNLQGIAQANVFLVQTDLINTITWSAPTSGVSPVSYQIYRDVGLAQLIATVSANGVLQYQDHNRQYNTTYRYYIVSVGGDGFLSQPALVVVSN
jgi:YVTN family beta-propeller protein